MFDNKPQFQHFRTAEESIGDPYKAKYELSNESTETQCSRTKTLLAIDKFAKN